MQPKILATLWCVVILVTGCASPSQMTTYNTLWSKEPLTIVAQKSDFSHAISISINDVEVCAGVLDEFSATAELHGEYEGHHVSATLEQVSKLADSPTRCSVFIDGELAGKFEL